MKPDRTLISLVQLTHYSRQNGLFASNSVTLLGHAKVSQFVIRQSAATKAFSLR